MSKSFSIALLTLILLSSWFYLSSQRIYAAPTNTTITVNTTNDELNNDGDCSLREAVIAANTDTAVDACPAGNGADTIIVPAGIYTLTLTGADENDAQTGDLDITSPVSINGAGAANTFIDGNAADRVFDIFAQTTLSQLAIQNGSFAHGLHDFDGGGGIRSSATLTLDHVTVSNNLSEDFGGGISNFSTLYLVNSSIIANQANNGGGIYNQYQTLIASSSIISGNSADMGGGLLNYYGATAILTDTLFSHNRAYNGAAIYNDQPATLHLQGGTVEYSQLWAAVENAGIASIEGTTLNDNAKEAIRDSSLQGMQISNASITRNGAAIIAVPPGTPTGAMTIRSSTITENGSGVQAQIPIVISDTLISRNHSAYGNGLDVTGGANAELYNVTVSENRFDDSPAGGGAGIAASKLKFIGGAVYSNALNLEDGTGGGILLYGNSELQDVTISGNYAPLGGGIYVDNTATVQITNITLANNQAAQGANIYHKTAKAQVKLKNTIVSAPVSSANCFGSITSQGNNLSDDTSCNLTAANDHPNTNPLIGPLQDNGGNTFTHALLVASPAIDAGTNKGCPKTDQRGIERPQDGDGNGSNLCDIGAYEYPASGSTTTPKLKAPKNKSVVTTTRPLLDWTDSAWVAHYEIEIYKNSPTGKLFATRAAAPSKLQAPKMGAGKYVWHVRSCNAQGCSAWTPFWKFTVAP